MVSVKIILSKHILQDKIPLLKGSGFFITQKQIKEVVANPDHLDKESDSPRLIASKSIDEKHVLRVVYKVENGIIKAITTYPAEKGRYY